MSLDAGEVYALLGARLNPAGFEAFGKSMQAAKAEMTAGEKALADSQARLSNGAKRSALVQEQAAGRAAAAQKRAAAESGAAMRASAQETFLAQKRAEAYDARVQAASKRTARSFQQIGTAARYGAAAGVVVLGTAVAVSIKKAADFEQAMRNVNSIAGLSEGQFRKLSTQVRGMAGETAQAPLTLAQGMYQLVSSGFKASESVSILHAAAIAASAGLTDTQTSVTALAGVLNAYHLPASQAAAVSDVLFQTVNRGVITFSELANSIGLVLPFATSLKIPLKDVGASISTLTKEGIPAADATTYLKNAMVAFLKPSKGLQLAIKATGAESGAALVKQKGFQGALEAVARTTDGTKGALQKLFPDIRASAAVFALTGANAKTAEGDVKAFGNTAGAAQKVFAEQSKSVSFQIRDLKANLDNAAITLGNKFLPFIDRGARALSGWLNQASASGQLDQIANGIFNGFQVAAKAVLELGQAFGQLAGAAGPVVGILSGVAHALDLGDPSHLAALIAAIAGFKVASIVGPMIATLATNLRLLATAPTMAALGGDLLAMVNPVTAVAVGVGALAAAFILLGGNESRESTLAQANAAAHRAQAQAIKDVAAAERGAADKGLAAKQSTLDLKQAQLDLNKARKQYGRDSPQYRQALLAEQRASLNATSAHNDYTKSLEAQHKASGKLVTDAQQRLEQARKDAQVARQPIAAGRATTPQAVIEQQRALAQAQANITRRVQEYEQALARANVSDLNRQRLMQSSTQITTRNAAGVSNLIHAISGLPKKAQTEILLSHDQDALARVGNLIATVKSVPARKAITTILSGDADVRVKLAAVTAIAHGVPARTVTKAIASTNSATVQLLALKALIAGVPPSKVFRAIAQTGDAQGQIAALKSAIASVHDKTVRVEVTTVNRAINTVQNVIHNLVTGGGGSSGQARGPKRAAGRGPMGAERAMVGEGRGPEWIVDPVTGRVTYVVAPTIMDLPASAYVIPTEDRYRGRALGLLADVAKSIGATGYAKGRKGKAPAKGHGKGKAKQLPIPPAITYAAVDETDFNHETDQARNAYKKRRDSVRQYEKKVRADEQALARAKGKSKGPARAKLTADRRQLAALRNGSKDLPHSLDELRAIWQADSRDLKALHAANVEIARLQTIQETDRQKMANAAGAGDAGAYGLAQKDRQGVLGKLKATYEKALTLAKSGSTMEATIGQQLASVVADLQDADQSYGAATSSGNTEQDRIDQTGMTDAEQAQLAELQKTAALAALTAGTGDDQAAAQSIQDFLTNVLGADTSGGRPVAPGGITAVAQALLQARQDVASFTGGGTNSNPDLQAQLDQANAKVQEVTTEAAANAALLSAFNASGDLLGHPAARAPVPHVTQNNYMLHPSDPQVLRTIGEAAVKGIDMQGYRRLAHGRVGG